MRIRIIVRGPLINGLANDLHARSLHDAGIDHLTQIDRIESAARVHVEHGREARLEVGLRVGHRSQGALRRCVAAGIQMNVRIDHAWEHRRCAQVDHLCAGGYLQVNAHVGNAVALNEHDLIVQQGARFGIKQTPRPDGNDMVLRRPIFRGRLRPRWSARCRHDHCSKHQDVPSLPAHFVLPFS